MKLKDRLIIKNSKMSEVEKICKLLKRNLEKEGNMTKREKYEIKYRYNHCLRVGHLALKIANELGLDYYHCNAILIAGLLHDVSKFFNNSNNHNIEGSLFADDILEKLHYDWDFIRTVMICIKNHSEKENYKFNKDDTFFIKCINIIKEGDMLDHLSHKAFKYYGFERNNGNYDSYKIMKIMNKFKYYDPENNFSEPGKKIYREKYKEFSEMHNNQIRIEIVEKIENIIK